MYPDDNTYYYPERNRLRTFDKSRRFFPPMVAELARNGFILYDGKVRCMFCCQVLEKFYSREPIVKRHFKLTKSCGVYMYKPNLNVPINEKLFQIEKEIFMQLRLEKSLEEAKNSILQHIH